MAGGNLRLALTITFKDLASAGLENFRRGFQRGMTGVRGDAESAGQALRAGMQSISTQLATLQRAVIAYQSVVGALRAGTEIIRAADDFRQLNARLILATGSAESAGKALDQVRRIAAANGEELASVGTLYARVATAMRDMGGSQAETAQVTEAVALALRVSGAGASESASAVLQLSQAFAAGALRGDEFNSVNEAAPRIMQALADHLGVTRGALRKMAEEGKLTAEVMGGALVGSLQKLRTESAQLPDTMEQAATRVKNAWVEMVARFDASTGASQRVAAAMNDVAKNMDQVASIGQTLAGGVLIVLAGRLISAWRAAHVGVGVMGALGAVAGGVLRMLGGWPALLIATGVGLYKLAQRMGFLRGAEDDLQRARLKSAASLGALLANTSRYQDATIVSARAARDLATAELRGYRERLAGALAYYNALYEAEARRGDKGDGKAKAEAAAQRDIYLKALVELRPVLAGRLKLEKDHSDALLRTRDEILPQLKAALDAQADLYEEAGRKVEDIQQRKLDALKRQTAFEAALQAGTKKAPEDLNYGDFQAAQAAARQAAVAGEADKAIAQVEELRAALRAMKDAGTETNLVLSGMAKELASIENTALEKAADQAEQEREGAMNKLIALQGIARSLEAIKIGVDQAAAETALRDTQARLQAFADANPIIQRVIVQAQDRMLLAANAPASIPGRAAGGPIFGPGPIGRDSVLSLLAPGEHVLTAAEVAAAGGHGAIYALRRALLTGALPRFAAGGAVAQAVARMPTLAGASAHAASAPQNLGRLDLALGGAGYPVYAEPDVAAALGRAVRRVAMQRGRR